jgi:hypothetical protein
MVRAEFVKDEFTADWNGAVLSMRVREEIAIS